MIDQKISIVETLLKSNRDPLFIKIKKIEQINRKHKSFITNGIIQTSKGENDEVLCDF